MEETLASSLKSSKYPFIISDMGDNPIAGVARDVTWTLNQLLNEPRFKSTKGPSLIYASIAESDLVASALETGVGGMVDGYAGA